MRKFYILVGVYRCFEVVWMGKGDALETKKISLVLPNKLYEKIDKLDMPDAISVQDKIRRLLAVALTYMEGEEVKG